MPPTRFERIDTGGWSPDAELRLADWTKQSWQLPRDLEGFLKHLNVQDEELGSSKQVYAVAAFMELPVAEHMPTPLREKLISVKLLEDTK